MKASLVILTAVAALAAGAPVSAASPAAKHPTALERQVRTLQAQVKTLQKQTALLQKTVDSNQDAVRSELGRNRVGDACLALAVADVFQSTWTTVDASAFGSQKALDDVSCKAIGVTRPGSQSPPSVDVFWALTGWLIG